MTIEDIIIEAQQMQRQTAVEDIIENQQVQQQMVAEGIIRGNL